MANYQGKTRFIKRGRLLSDGKTIGEIKRWYGNSLGLAAAFTVAGNMVFGVKGKTANGETIWVKQDGRYQGIQGQRSFSGVSSVDGAFEMVPTSDAWSYPDPTLEIIFSDSQERYQIKKMLDKISLQCINDSETSGQTFLMKRNQLFFACEDPTLSPLTQYVLAYVCIFGLLP